jgi:hypothetical protein
MNFIGTRRHIVPDARPDTALIVMEQGHFGLHEKLGWHGHPPGLDQAVDLGAYEVIEHDDLSITVNGGKPIALGDAHGRLFRGTLVHGVWAPYERGTWPQE